MTEEQIAAQLKQNITPEPTTEDVIPGVQPEQGDPDTPSAQSAIGFKLDDMFQYKLHDYFGKQYRPTDEISKQQVDFIYEKASKMIGTAEYSLVLTKIRDLEQILGYSNSDNRIYKLYQWLKLDSIRQNIDRQMEAIRG